VIARELGIIHVKVVILIAQLAVVRKVIVTDLYEAAPASVAALAALVLALGATYWLMRERDEPLPPQPAADQGSETAAGARQG
jgi:uncharacterized membrane protein (DUF373 family)